MRRWLGASARLGMALTAAAADAAWTASRAHTARRGAPRREWPSTLDALAETASSQLGEVPEIVHHAGVELVEDGVETIRGAIAGDRLRQEQFGRRLVDTLSILGSDIRGHSARREARSKAGVFWRVRRARASREGRRDGRPFDLEPALGEILRREDPIYTFFALEGLAHDYVKAHLDLGGTAPGGLFDLPAVRRLDAGQLAALHAGLGLAASEFLLGGLHSGAGTRQFERSIDRFVGLCRSNAVGPRFRDVAEEVLGLVAAVFFPRVRSGLEAALRGRERLRRLYWHGAGRGAYFSGGQLLPGYGSLARAVELLDARVPASPWASAAHSGVGYAMTMVNIGEPDVVAGALLDARIPSIASVSVSTGVAGALSMQELLGQRGQVEAFLVACADRMPADLFHLAVAQPFALVRGAGREHRLYGSLPWGTSA